MAPAKRTETLSRLYSQLRFVSRNNCSRTPLPIQQTRENFRFAIGE